MKSYLQLHLVVPEPGSPVQISETELELIVVWVVGERRRTAGVLRVPALLLRQLQQTTPLLGSLIPDDVAITWTGEPLEPLPPDPMLGRLAKLLRGLKRLWGEKLT